MADDSIIIGKLDSTELEKSIDKLVAYVGNKTNEMAASFTEGLKQMTDAMKNFAVTQKVSVDTMQDAWRKMSTSFDAMVAAQSGGTGGTGGGSHGGSGGGASYPDNTVGALEENISELKKQRKELELNSDKLREQNRLIDEQTNKLKEQTTSVAAKRLEKVTALPTKDLDDAKRKLTILEWMQQRYANTTDLSAAQQRKLTNAIAQTKREIERINNSRPKTLKEVLGMDESSVDAVAKKMRMLRTVSVDPNNASQVRQLGNEYQRLSRLQADLLGKGIQLTHSNNYLAQSFGYIRNRIVYAMTLGAVTNFVKQIYEVRGSYEMLERSLGILIDDMRRGSEIFQELNAMALKSPFTLMELATGAKQLLAYNFAEEEVVDTTRRLADISAALGVPMERLVYNLGQIKAQTALTARDARDFANAGLAIVPMLAQMYTEEKRFGDEIVTTAQVFDMMSNKMVTYADVMKVINKVTDEGGKFFDFQAKQADTLKVKMANLTLAWNNMLNEIGQENQSTLTLPIKGLKLLFENWRQVYNIVSDLVILYGVYRARAILVAAINGTLITQGYISAARNLGRAWREAAAAMNILKAAVVSNPLGAFATVALTVAAAFGIMNSSVSDAVDYQEKFGSAGAKTVADVKTYFETLQNVSKESSNYTKVMAELNSILGEYNLELVTENDSQEQLNEKRRISIQLIKEEILERKHLNEIEQGRSEYETKVQNIRKDLREQLSNAITENFIGIGTVNEEIAKNAPAIANIVSDVIENNISKIAGKTGDEYKKGVDEIFKIINERMRAIGISDETIEKAWLKNDFFRMFNSNIITEAIESYAKAKNELNEYSDAIDRAYESEKKAADEGANFNDRVEQTQTQLMKAANDTDKFAKKIEALLKEYGGQNIIDFLVKVRTEVPSWMSQKGLKELTQLSARFTALATNAKKAGKNSMNVNGQIFTTEQLFMRAAQYAQAAQNKAADIEQRRTTTLTKEASNALKDYKTAIEAVTIAKNKLKQGTADQALVTEKEADAQKKYNDALKKGVSEEELKKAKSGNKKGGGSKKDEFGDALTKQIQLISDMQKLYKEYVKAGVDADQARIATAKEYEKTLRTTYNTLSKYGVKGLTGEQLSTMDLRSLREYYTGVLEIASKAGNTKGVEALEKAIRSLNTEITKVDYKKITDGLNNELGKLKDEYELAVELDASPELGDIFADMMGLSKEELASLPRDFQGVMDKLQTILDSKVDGFDLSKNLNKSNLEEWITANGIDLQSELAKQLMAYVDYANKVRKDEAAKQISEWDKLLEKYAEYEYKRKQILDTYERDMATAIKRGAGQDIIDAITNKRDKDMAQLDFERFQQMPEWVMATGEISTMTEEAIGGLIKKLEEYKKTAKNLDAKQIKQINNALKNLYKEQRRNNPFKAIANVMDLARERFEDYQVEIEKVEKELKKYKDIDPFKMTSAEKKSFEDLQNRWKELKQLQEEASHVDTSEWISAIKSTSDVITDAIGLFDELAKAIGGVEKSDLDRIFGVISKAFQGAQTGSSFGTYGAIIGAVVGAASGIITEYKDVWNGNERINKQLKESEQRIRILTTAYNKLQHQVEEAYGDQSLGAKKLMALNKEMELAELERQLELEKSRNAKDRDLEKIADLEDKVNELRYEVENATKEMIMDLLDISDTQDWADNLVKSMIEAFRQGEDYMKAYDQSFEDMIDSMITKAIMGKVIGEKIEELLGNIEERSIKRGDPDNNPDVQAAKAYMDDIQRQYNTLLDLKNDNVDVPSHVIDEAKRMLEAAMDKYNEEYKKAVKITPEDVASVKQDVEDWRSGVKSEFEAYMDAFGVAFGSSKEAQSLSALQQGIQGVTETTAGAIEAYMNGMAQQSYLHSELLTEIRDAVIGYNFDVQVATMSQMFLQLQESYQVQMAIQGILEGWSAPNGLAVRVQMVS